MRPPPSPTRLTPLRNSPVLPFIGASNTAAGNGGGIFNYYGGLTLTNVTISGNSASNYGGIDNEQSGTVNAN